MSRIERFPAPSSGSGGETYKAGEGLAEEGSKPTTFKIFELSKYIVKAAEQTITGLKAFTGITPTEEREPGIGEEAKPAIEVLGIVGGQPGKAAVEETLLGIGGVGSELPLSAGPGAAISGYTAAEAAQIVGGAGGEAKLTSGTGGTATPQTTAEGRGGAGGKAVIAGGKGGEALGTGSGIHIGGHGGEFELAAGTGGKATTGSGPGVRTGGEGGGFLMVAGKGGEGATKGGAGGAFVAHGGAAGTGGTPVGGEVKFAGGAASTEALSGSVNFVTGTGTGTTRMSINGEGVVSIKGATTVTKTLAVTEGIVGSTTLKLTKAVGLWAHTPPASQHARIAKVEEASALDTLLQLIEKTNEIRTKLNEVTQEVLPEYGITA